MRGAKLFPHPLFPPGFFSDDIFSRKVVFQRAGLLIPPLARFRVFGRSFDGEYPQEKAPTSWSPPSPSSPLLLVPRIRARLFLGRETCPFERNLSARAVLHVRTFFRHPADQVTFFISPR